MNLRETDSQLWFPQTGVESSRRGFVQILGFLVIITEKRGNLPLNGHNGLESDKP
jgi:hypothetical protein